MYQYVWNACGDVQVQSTCTFVYSYYRDTEEIISHSLIYAKFIIILQKVKILKYRIYYRANADVLWCQPEQASYRENGGFDD